MRDAACDVDSLYPKGVGPGSKLWIDGNGLGCVCLGGGLFPCVRVSLARFTKLGSICPLLAVNETA